MNYELTRAALDTLDKLSTEAQQFSNEHWHRRASDILELYVQEQFEQERTGPALGHQSLDYIRKYLAWVDTAPTTDATA